MSSTQQNVVSIVSAKDPIKIAWENVVVRGLSTEQNVRPEVLRSWIKCKKLNLDPFSRKPPAKLSLKKLERCLAFNRQLIEVSQPVVRMVEIAIKDTGFIVMLTDKDGYILMLAGHKDILKMAEKNHIQIGIQRSTECVGTNGTGLCIEEDKPIQVTGAEHYMAYNHLWTCSTAPIHDSQGQIVGVVTLSGKSIGKHQHTLALVTAAAETIESQLREIDLIEEKKLLNNMLTSIFNSISEGVISLDEENKITHLNSVAANMLELDSETVIGKQFNKVVSTEKKFAQALVNKIDFPGDEFNFNCPSGIKTYICRIDPISNYSSLVSGKLITIIEKRKMINIAKKISGSFAKYEFSDIKGKNSMLQEQIRLAKVAARTNSRVLVIGESGTGKELFAQAIHNFSQRKNQPFIAISCAAIPRDLIESEFFGYKGGAFTGARQNGMVGKFEIANKGTLFLDEVNSLPLELQSKLLRALQQNEVMRLGDTRPIPVDVRIISASSIDLLSEVKNNNFREDLYYRLNVIELFIPPLRARIDDLELLTSHVLERQCRVMEIRKAKISPEVFEIMMAYSWPGNIRELENCIERALLLSQGKIIRKCHLSVRSTEKISSPGLTLTSLRQGSKVLIETALKKNGRNVTKAARMLGVSRSTLYRKMKEFDLS